MSDDRPEPPAEPERSFDPHGEQPAAAEPAAPLPSHDAAPEPTRIRQEPSRRGRAERPARARPSSAASCLLGAFALSIMGGLGLCLISGALPGAVGGALVEQTVSGDRDAPAKVLLIEYEGVIAAQVGGGLFEPGFDLVERIGRQLDQAAKDDEVRAVVLALDTPGGTVTASDRIWHRIKRFRDEAKKPVVLHMGAVCASGGYYIASACDEIRCEPTTITGSIGVLLSGLNFHGLLEKYGVRDVTIASGANKALLNPTSPVSESHIAILQGMVDDAYDRFVQLVDEGRPALDEAQVRQLADGRIYTANQALELELVDGIGYLDDSVEAAKQLAGVSQARLVRYRSPPTLAEALAGNVRAPAAPALRLDPAAIDELASPRLLAIWRGR